MPDMYRLGPSQVTFDVRGALLRQVIFDAEGAFWGWGRVLPGHRQPLAASVFLRNDYKELPGPTQEEYQATIQRIAGAV